MNDTLNIPAKELGDAIKSLNEILEKKDRIKTVGPSKEKKIADFTQIILAIIKDGNEDAIPKTAANVYETYIKEQMNADAKAPASENSTAKKGAARKPAGKPAAGKKTAGASKPAAGTGKKTVAGKPAAGTGKKTTGKPAAGKAGKKTAGASKPAAAAVERDEFGFSVNTKKHDFIVMISEKPMKMAEIKAATGDSYYNTIANFSDRILKTETAHYYVKGSPAEELAKQIVADTKKAVAAKEAAKAPKVTPKGRTSNAAKRGNGKATTSGTKPAATGKKTTGKPAAAGKKTTTKRRPAAKK